MKCKNRLFQNGLLKQATPEHRKWGSGIPITVLSMAATICWLLSKRLMIV